MNFVLCGRSFYHVLSFKSLFLEVWNKGYIRWSTLFGEFQHLEHPIGNVAYVWDYCIFYLLKRQTIAHHSRLICFRF